MRFHIGFSKRISWKWLLLIGGGLLAFFGIGNHVVLAASMSADATATYVVSPYGAIQGGGIETGDLIDVQSGTPYCTTWASQRYCAFNTITSPYTSLGKGSNIKNARLRWTFSTSSMAKCTSSQAINYNMQLFLRNINSGSLPNLWDTPNLYTKFWIRSSQENYDCSVISKSDHVINVSCTLPNPTSNVYFYVEGLTIPLSEESNSSTGNDYYYNVGVMPVSYTCSGLDSAGIINSVNSSATNIMNNQNQNTQLIVNEITTMATDNVNAISDLNDTINNDDLPDIPNFSIENMGISSQSQKLFMLPIQLLEYVMLGELNECRPLRVDLTSLGLLWPSSNTGTEIIQIPCMRQKVKNLIGESWYDVFDRIMAAIVFYYFATNVVVRIQQVMSGVDTLPSFYTSHGKTKTLLVDNGTGEVING